MRFGADRIESLGFARGSCRGRDKSVRQMSSPRTPIAAISQPPKGSAHRPQDCVCKSYCPPVLPFDARFPVLLPKFNLRRSPIDQQRSWQHQRPLSEATRMPPRRSKLQKTRCSFPPRMDGCSRWRRMSSSSHPTTRQRASTAGGIRPASANAFQSGAVRPKTLHSARSLMQANRAAPNLHNVLQPPLG
jgi:hypothetical protein